MVLIRQYASLLYGMSFVKLRCTWKAMLVCVDNISGCGLGGVLNFILFLEAFFGRLPLPYLVDSSDLGLYHIYSLYKELLL